MLNSVFLLSDDYTCFRREMKSALSCKIYLSFLTDASNEERLLKAYQFFSETEVSHFSLSLVIKNYPDNSVLENIISFFFIPAYYNINNQFLINLICDDNSILENTTKKLIELSGQQGLDNLMINHLVFCKKNIVEPDRLKKLESCIFYDLETLLIKYEQILSSTEVFTNMFYLNDKREDVQSVYKMVQQVEHKMKIKNPIRYKMAIQIQLLSDEIFHLKNINNCTNDELDNYKTHLEILSSSHEAKVIQYYYDNEYETLPLWYKQLGHLIKVVMGKRSFRSLFNDNIKKYKD